MPYRLIAIDLDDTLLNDQLQISERNQKAIRDCIKAGINVTLATGRMFKSCLPYARQLNLNLPLIAYHGALVRDIDSEKVYYYRPLDLERARAITEAAEEKGYYFSLFINDCLYIQEENEYSRYYQGIASVEVVPVGALSRFLKKQKEGPAKILFISWDDIHKEETFLGGLRYEDINIMRSRKFFLEVTHREATKGHALQVLARKLGIESQEIIAIGDSYNDIHMLEYAGLGVAVGNASNEVRQKADFVTKSNLEDGVAEVIEKYVL